MPTLTLAGAAAWSNPCPTANERIEAESQTSNLFIVAPMTGYGQQTMPRERRTHFDIDQQRFSPALPRQRGDFLRLGVNSRGKAPERWGDFDWVGNVGVR
jgi:hypothetical protein